MEYLGHQIHPIISIPKPMMVFRPSLTHNNHLKTGQMLQFRWCPLLKPVARPMGSGAYAMASEKPDQEQELDADRWISQHFGWSSRWAPVVNPEAQAVASDELNEPDQKHEADLDRWILASEGDDGGELGLAEELEQLEEEAIAGDDVGRDATDYDRRARLFDESARVFQDLKERDGHSCAP